MLRKSLSALLCVVYFFTSGISSAFANPQKGETYDNLSPWSRISQMCSIDRVEGRLEVRLKDNSEAIRLGIGILKHIVANSLRRDLDLTAEDVRSLIDTHCGKFISSGAFGDLYWQRIGKRNGAFYMPALDSNGEEVMLRFSRVTDDELPVGDNFVPIKDGFVSVDVVERALERKVTVGAESFDLEVGAFTGAVNVDHLVEAGINSAIIGHSETRQDKGDAGDTDEVINKKLKAAVDKIDVTLCCGEPLYVRRKGEHKDFVIAQLNAALHGISAMSFAGTVKAIAYEPIWAIGTGEKASPEQAQEMCSAIRDFLRSRYGDDIADNTIIQYGGSVTPANALELLSQPDIDGALIGGAALRADSFSAIAEKADSITGKARPILISANWKASEIGEGKGERDTPEDFFIQLEALRPSNINVMIFTPSTITSQVNSIFEQGLFYAQPPKGRTGIIVGVGNYGMEEGPHTGVVNAEHIAEAGITAALVGHSETRSSSMLKGDNNLYINKKIRAADGKFKITLCCGESLQIREAGSQQDFVVSQLRKGLLGISKEQFERTVMAIAYEPIWAIGTGKKASADQAQEMCKAIRDFIRSEYGDATADALRIQYGGSVTPANALELLSQPDIDGALIGGAALRAESFANIVEIADGITGKRRALLIAGNWKAGILGDKSGQRDWTAEFMWRLQAARVKNVDVAIFANSAIATNVKTILAGNMPAEYPFEGHVWECTFKSDIKRAELEGLLEEVPETEPNSLILYADEMIDKGAVLDLADTIKSQKVKDSGLLRGSSIILFVKNRAKTDPQIEALKRIIEGADSTIDVVVADRSDLNGNISDDSGEVKALKNLASQKLRRATGLAPTKEQFLGVFRGANEDMHVIPEISSDLEMPMVIFGNMNGIYSFAEALEKALSIRYSKSPSKWFAYLEPIKLLNVEKLRHDFEVYVNQVLIRA